MNTVLTTRVLIVDHGIPTNLVCSCCRTSSQSLWNIGEYFLCSWCDLPSESLYAGHQTTTLDEPVGALGALLRLRRDGEGWYVSDLIGLRYGWGATIGEALAMWSDCVADALGEDEARLADPYLSEVRAYKQALK